jgi:AraC-like DNA-binding protein
MHVMPADHAEILRSGDLDGLEVLHASYETFAFAPHRHAAHVLALVESGTHAFDHRGRVVVAPAGTMLFLDPDERHTGYGYRRSRWSYRVLYIEPKWFCDLAGAIPHFEPSAVRDDALADAVRALCTAMRTPRSALQQQTLMLDIANRSLRHSDRRAPVMHAMQEPDAVRRARELIDDRFDENLTLAELASVAGLSAYRLSHAFKHAVGFAPHQYLTSRRVERAKLLLRAGEAPADVAAAVGFCDQAHLTRQFRHRVGVTPAQYRAERRNTRNAVSA